MYIDHNYLLDNRAMQRNNLQEGHMHAEYVLDLILQKSAQGMCQERINRLQKIGVWFANGTLPMCHKIAST